MSTTYEAILDGERLTWVGRPPHLSGPTRIRVEVREEADRATLPKPGNGRAVAEAARRAAAAGGVPSIADPVAWQREQREDRPLPGRPE